MLRMAIIGIGAMGKKYALQLNEGKVKEITLSAVCCRSEANQTWVRENLAHTVEIYPDVEALFKAQEQFDAVLIVTPHKEHPSIAIEAFKHHKHVFCDKPAGVTALEAERMSKAAKKAGTTYAMMFHNRIYPIHQHLKQMLRQNELGEILRIMLESSRNYRTKHYHDSASWRSSFAGEGGGALINQGQHLLDLWQWLFGMPEAISAKIPFGKYNDFLVDDEVTMIMSYPNNLYGTFILSTGEAFGGDRFEIVGTKGRVVVEGNRMHYWKSDRDTKEYGKMEEVNTSEKLGITYEVIEFEPPKEAYVQMLQNFAEAILKGDKLMAPGVEGENALILANAAYLSAWKKEEIKIPFDTQSYQKHLDQKIQEEMASKS